MLLRVPPPTARPEGRLRSRIAGCPSPSRVLAPQESGASVRPRVQVNRLSASFHDKPPRSGWGQEGAGANPAVPTSEASTWLGIARSRLCAMPRKLQPCEGDAAAISRSS